MDARRRSDGHNEPQMQVVGFHVEGQSPSPNPIGILQDSLRTISTGSPTPVIIPPHFQRESSLNRSTTESGATRSLAPEFAAGAASQRTPTHAERQPGTPSASAEQSTPFSPAAIPAQRHQQQQQAQQQAPPAALSQTAAPSAASSSTPNSQDNHNQQQQQPAAGTSSNNQADSTAAQSSSSSAAAAPSSDAGKGNAADGHKPPPKNPKPTSKAERRVLQEAQRAAKAASKGATAAGGGKGGNNGAGGAAAAAVKGAGGQPPGTVDATQAGASKAQPAADPSSDADAAGKGSGLVPVSGYYRKPPAKQSGNAAGHKGRGPVNTLNSTELFAHLQQYRPVSVEGVLRSKEGGAVHHAVLALGLRYADGSIKGSTARCVAMVHSLCQVIADYHTPVGKSLPRDLLSTINASVDFLVRCRPLSVSMGNAIKALKLYISKIDPAAPEEAAKSLLLGQMQEWLNEKVAVADKVLVEHAVTKVYDGDVILTYAYSQVVLEVLLAAARQGKRFRVIVLDSRPELEGRQMLRRLLQADIACGYVLLSGLSYIMREVSKVMLGAAAVLSNGTVFSRAGSAAVAMSAAASSKPVLVCCEAFKFHERVQLDSITHNELGDPDVLAYLPPFAPGAALSSGPADPVKGVLSQGMAQWRDSPRLALLNLKYDAMPAEYVTMVVTEFGMIPPSSVPVILREYSESAQLE